MLRVVVVVGTSSSTSYYELQDLHLWVDAGRFLLLLGSYFQHALLPAAAAAAPDDGDDDEREVVEGGDCYTKRTVDLGTQHDVGRRDDVGTVVVVVVVVVDR